MSPAFCMRRDDDVLACDQQCSECAFMADATPAPAGTKHDGDKPRVDLLDPFALEAVARVLGFGARKYAAHNWRGGIALSRLLGAALRHVFARLRGERFDPESGEPHLAHAMCCLMFAIWTEAHRPELDDLWRDPRGEPQAPTPAAFQYDFTRRFDDLSPEAIGLFRLRLANILKG